MKRRITLWAGEKVAALDAVQFPAQPRHCPPPCRRIGGPHRCCFGCHRVVFGGDCGGHPAHHHSNGLGIERAAQPEGCFAAVVGDFLGDPLQLLAGARVGGQRHQPVAELGHTEPLELAPHGRSWCGRHAGQPVGQQYPVVRLAHAITPAASVTEMRPRLR
jgi:hypothetical protein